MNRTSNSLRMAALLYENGMMKISEIAEYLGTNPRNVREYIKELRGAGIEIVSKSGHYGGINMSPDSDYYVISREEYKSLGCEKRECPMNNNGYCEGE